MMFSLAEAAPADQTAAPPLFDNLGSLHHPITTTSEQAQRYFDQGLRLVYAFNHEEAIRSFEAAAQEDPQAAMPYWGIALALGPNINSAMEKKDEHRAVEMVQKARQLADRATPGEQAYIDALVTRYVGRKGAKRKRLDEAYAKEAGYPSVIAPPTLICETCQYAHRPPTADGYIGHEWHLPVANCRLIRAGNDYEFMRPVLPEDRISATWTLEDIVERSSSRGGTQLFVTSVARYRDTKGEVVAVNRETLVYQPL